MRVAGDPVLPGGGLDSTGQTNREIEAWGRFAARQR